MNGKMLDKIVDVNNRKVQSLNNKGSIVTHKSLSNLKRSMQNIEIENQKIAKKLIETKSGLKQERLVGDYKDHVERKERINKYVYD